MTTFSKVAISLVCAVVITGAIWGAYQYPKAIQVVVGSAVGSKFSSAKIAAVAMVPSTRTATSSSVYNGDESARWIQSGFVSCAGVTTVYTDLTGAGLAGWSISAATTTTDSQGLQANTNHALNLALGTSTPWLNLASTTASTTYPSGFSTNILGLNGYWPASTYLTFLFNATSSTATCTVGVNYIPA